MFQYQLDFALARPRVLLVLVVVVFVVVEVIVVVEEEEERVCDDFETRVVDLARVVRMGLEGYKERTETESGEPGIRDEVEDVDLRDFVIARKFL